MGTVQMHLHITEQAAEILDKYCSKRTRGAFLSDLVIAYERRNDIEGFVDALKREADDAARRASQAAHALSKARDIQQPAVRSKKRR